MEMMKALRSVTWIVVAFFVLSGFALSSNVEITFFTFPTAAEQALAQVRVDGWKAANPEYKDAQVNIVGGWMGNLFTLAVAGTTPDIIMYSSSELGQIAYKGILADLDPWITSDQGFRLASLLPSAVEAVTYNGSVKGIPSGIHVLATLYNADILASRGVKVPGADWTWNDLVSLGKKLTFDSDGDSLVDSFGFGDQWVSHHRFPVWVWGAGGEFYNAELTKSHLDQDAAIKGLEFYTSLYQEHHIAAKVINKQLAETGLTTTASNHAISTDLFNRGKMAFYNNMRPIPETVPVSYGVLPLPMGPQSRTSLMATQFFAMGSTTKHPEAVWSLLKYIASEAGFTAGRQLESINYISADTRLATRQVERHMPEIGAKNWMTMAETARKADLFHPAVGMPVINWDSIARGDKPVREVVSEAASTQNALLSEAWQRGPQW